MIGVLGSSYQNSRSKIKWGPRRASVPTLHMDLVPSNFTTHKHQWRVGSYAAFHHDRREALGLSHRRQTPDFP